MTTITVDIRVPTGNGDRGARGYMLWTPTRRRNVEGIVILPNPFTVRLVDGKAEFTIDSTDNNWLWKVDEMIENLPKNTVYFSIPTADIEYAKLVPVDPDTYIPDNPNGNGGEDSEWHIGEGPPDESIGDSLDMYIDEATGLVYKRI